MAATLKKQNIEWCGEVNESQISGKLKVFDAFYGQ